MIIRAVACALAAPAVLVSTGCSSADPSPAQRSLVRTVVAETEAVGIELSMEQGACIVIDAERIGGAEAIAQMRRHPDLRQLRGTAGRAVAQAYGGCVGANFIDVWGYEP